MEKELYGKGELQIKLIGADLVLVYEGLGGSVTVKVGGEYFLDKLADAIPGQIDDAIIDVIKAALKG